MASYNPFTGQKIDCCPPAVPQEMPTHIVRERWFICEKCDHFKEGRCNLISVELAEYVRGIGAKCHIGKW